MPLKRPFEIPQGLKIEFVKVRVAAKRSARNRRIQRSELTAARQVTSAASVVSQRGADFGNEPVAAFFCQRGRDARGNDGESRVLARSVSDQRVGCRQRLIEMNAHILDRVVEPDLERVREQGAPQTDPCAGLALVVQIAVIEDIPVK